VYYPTTWLALTGQCNFCTVLIWLVCLHHSVILSPILTITPSPPPGSYPRLLGIVLSNASINRLSHMGFPWLPLCH